MVDSFQYLHVTDFDDLTKETKISGEFEYLEELKQNFKQNCIFVRKFHVIECMIEYFGKNGTFQRSFRIKPVRSGCKL